MEWQLDWPAFANEDAEIIKRIPLLRTSQKDKLLWHCDKKGQYTVRSGYHLALNFKFAAFPTSSTGDSHGWHTIWTLNYQRRSKSFCEELTRTCCQIQKTYQEGKLCKNQCAKSAKLGLNKCFLLEWARICGGYLAASMACKEQVHFLGTETKSLNFSC